MQTIVAGLMSLTAMGASILAEVDPVTTVVRGSVAFVAGMLLASVWSMVVMPQAKDNDESADDVDDEVESDDDFESEEPQEQQEVNEEVAA